MRLSLPWAVRPTAGMLANQLRAKYLPARGDVVGYDPPTLHFHLTARCTHRCVMCAQVPENPVAEATSRPRPAPDLPLDLYRQALALFPNSPKVLLAGNGEPLLHPEFATMAALAVAQRRQLTVITNGLLLGDQLDTLAGRPVYKVAVSLNEATAERYQARTRTPAGSFDRVRENIRALAARRRRTGWPRSVTVSFILDRENADEWEAYLALAADLGADGVALINLLGTVGPSGRLTLTDRDTGLLARLELLCRQYRSRLRIDRPVILQTDPVRRRCRQAAEMLIIDGAGNVSGCGRVMPPDAAYGNLLTEGRAVWNNPHFRGLRRLARERRFAEHPLCRECMGC